MKDSIIQSLAKWFIENPVAANILMVILLIGGGLSMKSIPKEVIPEIGGSIVNVTAVYQGSSPSEIESSLLKPIESVVKNIMGVDSVSTSAGEGSGSVVVNLDADVDDFKLLQEIQSAIDKINTFPENSESPKAKLVTIKARTLNVVLYGDESINTLMDYAHYTKEKLEKWDEVSEVIINDELQREIKILIDQDKLLSNNLTINNVMQAIKSSSLTAGIGAINTSQGEVLIEVSHILKNEVDFKWIEIKKLKNAESIFLKDIAEVIAGVDEKEQQFFYSDKRAVQLSIFGNNDSSPQEIANSAIQQLERIQYPENIGFDIIENNSDAFQDRLDLLVSNGIIGLVLVFLSLTLFLEVRLAFWVMLGLPISLIAAFFIMEQSGASLNMISMFAMLVTLGVVVDDAVIVGENIYEKREMGLDYKEAAILGVTEMAPVIFFAVATNVVVFIPLFFIDGFLGAFFKTIPLVIISVFIISLLESLFILPSHLLHGETKKKKAFIIRRLFIAGLEKIINGPFRKSVIIALNFRYATVAFAVGLLIMSTTLISSGKVPFQSAPSVESDIITATLKLPYGTPMEKSIEVFDKIMFQADQSLKEFNYQAKNIYGSIGLKNRGFDLSPSGSHDLSIYVNLGSDPDRSFSSSEYIKMWEDKIGVLPLVKSQQFTSSLIGSDPIQVNFNRDEFNLRSALLDFEQEMLRDSKVRNIVINLDNGKPKLQVSINEYGKELGYTDQYIANELRMAISGSVVYTDQLDRYDQDVVVKLNLENSNITTLEHLEFKNDIARVKLKDIADIKYSRASTNLERIDGKAITPVYIELFDNNESSNMSNYLKTDVLPRLSEKYDMNIELGGSSSENIASFDQAITGFILSIFIIYGLLAIAFNHYWYPFVVLVSIPFGIIGAIWGHYFLGYTFTFISLIGVIGLSGIVINDSLVLVVTVNNYRRAGMSALESIISATQRRFRPIFLTTFTTFVGLVPLLFETSLQAKFLIPMALSLAFGILFSTLIILFLVPALLLIVDDMGNLIKKFKKAL